MSRILTRRPPFFNVLGHPVTRSPALVTREPALRFRSSARSCLLKTNQHNLRLRTHSHRRSPGARAAGPIHDEFAKFLQAVVVGAKDPRREPGKRKHLPTVGIPR